MILKGICERYKFSTLKKEFKMLKKILISTILCVGMPLIASIDANEKVYGVTIDSIHELDKTIDALNYLDKDIVSRVVFDEVDPSYYTNALKRLDPYTEIMGELFDSEYISHYTRDEYLDRVNDYLDELGDWVSLWEIGNEVNGEWSGDPDTVAQKTMDAYREVKSRGYSTALTLYYNDYTKNDGCWSNSDEKMRDWARDRLDQDIKEGIDFIFISYYEEDCDYHRPSLQEWENVFSDLGKIFPNAKLGFGEVGTTTQNKEDYFNHYYGLDIQNPRYIGGHFWWYFRGDMVPRNKSMWHTFNTFLEEQ